MNSILRCTGAFNLSTRVKKISVVCCILVATLSVFTLPSSTYAYEMSPRDTMRMRDMTERLSAILQKNNWSDSMYNSVQAALGRVSSKATISEAHKAILSGAQENIKMLYDKKHDDAYFGIIRTFRTQYEGDVLTPFDEPKNLANCFDHYPIVNAYAKRVGKPTPLLMAMWFIESSCAMNNPNNRDGIFQIIHNDYEPGPIGTQGLVGQLDDFGKFMDGKRNWYFKKNPNAPRELGYTNFSYNALQTFAALYNGIDLDAGISVYPLLNGNPYYFLANSSDEYKSKRDGILVFFLKLSRMEEKWFGR